MARMYGWVKQYVLTTATWGEAYKTPDHSRKLGCDA